VSECFNLLLAALCLLAHITHSFKVVDSDLLVAIDTEVADTQQTTLVKFD